MKKNRIKEKLIRLVGKEEYDDERFLMNLEEYEEAPLFVRYKSVEFMKKIEEEERCMMITEVALDLLDRIAKIIKANDKSGTYFVCITYYDWNEFETGELAIPYPCIFLSPHADREIEKLYVCKVETKEGRMASSWVKKLGREDICVAESEIKEEGKPKVVYIGYREDRGLLSIGSYIKRKMRCNNIVQVQ